MAQHQPWALVLLRSSFRRSTDRNDQESVEYLASQFEPPSFVVLQQMINALMEFMNSTRQWILKGHAPSEIQREEKKLLRPLPQKPLVSQPPQGAGEVIDFRTRTKVGRNDPCPCGSGKKFKRCCGKRYEQRRGALLRQMKP